MAYGRKQAKQAIKSAGIPMFLLFASLADGVPDRDDDQDVIGELRRLYEELRSKGNRQKCKPIKAEKYFKWLFSSHIDVLEQLEYTNTKPALEAIFVASYDFISDSLSKDRSWSKIAPELLSFFKGS